MAMVGVDMLDDLLKKGDSRRLAQAIFFGRIHIESAGTTGSFRFSCCVFRSG